jgi:hypothetical protein
MVEERNYLKNMKIKTLVESEIQREHIKNAIYQMQVWNTFDPKIIYHIVGKEKLYEGKGVGGGDLTVDELVRKTAITQHRKKMDFSNTNAFQSLNSSNFPTHSIPLTDRNNSRKQKNQFTSPTISGYTTTNFYNRRDVKDSNTKSSA